jgi:hypothetical protein
MGILAILSLQSAAGAQQSSNSLKGEQVSGPNEVTVRSSIKLSSALALELDLVRGGIRIGEESPKGHATLVAVSKGIRSSPNSVKLRVDTLDGLIRIRPEYPRRLRGSSEFLECLPPEDERGDFFHSDVGIYLTLDIPAGTRVTARILAGDIEANAPNSDLDLQTSTGRVFLRSNQLARRSWTSGGERVVAHRAKSFPD